MRKTKPSVFSGQHLFTEPVVYLLQPYLTRAFRWWVKEDDLILYPNFMYNRLQRHAPFQELGTEEHERHISVGQ